MSGFGTARAEAHPIETETASVCVTCRREVTLDFEGGELVWLHVAPAAEQ
jgi:hypothetical protein